MKDLDDTCAVYGDYLSCCAVHLVEHEIANSAYDGRCLISRGICVTGYRFHTSKAKAFADIAVRCKTTQADQESRSTSQ